MTVIQLPISDDDMEAAFCIPMHLSRSASVLIGELLTRLYHGEMVGYAALLVIGERAGMNRRTVQRAIRKLRAHAFLNDRFEVNWQLIRAKRRVQRALSDETAKLDELGLSDRRLNSEVGDRWKAFHCMPPYCKAPKQQGNAA